MKNLIEQAKNEFIRRILADEYELIRLEEYSLGSYIFEVYFSVDEYTFQYAIAKDFICDHSQYRFLGDEQEKIIDHFFKKFNDSFNSEEIKKQKIKELEARIKALKS